jgi:hypothetical protein
MAGAASYDDAVVAGLSGEQKQPTAGDVLGIS